MKHFFPLYSMICLFILVLLTLSFSWFIPCFYILTSMLVASLSHFELYAMYDKCYLNKDYNYFCYGVPCSDYPAAEAAAAWLPASRSLADVPQTQAPSDEALSPLPGQYRVSTGALSLSAAGSAQALSPKCTSAFRKYQWNVRQDCIWMQWLTKVRFVKGAHI